MAKYFSDKIFGILTHSRHQKQYTLSFIFEILCAIWYLLYNFKKNEKHPLTSVTFSKIADFSLQLY